MSSLKQRLSMAACTLVAAGVTEGAEAQERLWEIDASYLMYAESDDRVSVSKTLAKLSRDTDSGVMSVSLVHDTMSGASPTGAIRSENSAVTYTSASGGTNENAENGGDYSRNSFEDTRIQAGLGWEQPPSNSALAFSFGGAVSQESDYDSYGANVGVAKESADRLTTYSTGVALTFDTIYRSDTGLTPEPLGNVQQRLPYSKGSRKTLEGIMGLSQVFNQQTIAQVNVSFSVSDGYHSDPYKIISAADDEELIMANFHDSRPDKRLRSTLFGKLVHQLRDSKNSIHLSYRLYLDDWGIQSHTVDLRYRHELIRRQYLEPHVRFYRQSQADFYIRKLPVDGGLNPILPESGLASADYRLDEMTSTTLGLKYGIVITSNTDLRVRAEYLDQAFSTADYDSNTAVIFQTSLKYRF